MTRYRDPNAPKGRVVFGGVTFTDGVTADFEPGPSTLLLFKSQGITPIEPVETLAPETDVAPLETADVPDETEPAPAETPVTKPASRRSK